MRIGIGLPAAIPGAHAPALGDWAARSEDLGFRSVGVIDRLLYDNLDPLVALAAAASRTTGVELLTTVLNVPYRLSPVVLAKQIASLDRLSGGRVTAGLGLGGWPADTDAAGLARAELRTVMDTMVLTMRRAWAGELSGAGGPMPALGPDRPGLLFGGLAPSAYARAARFGQGWVAPSFGYEPLVAGVAGVRRAWAAAGRSGRPRVVVERYFSLGEDAGRTADQYLAHYYGAQWVDPVRADTPTTLDHLGRELERLGDAGADDVVLLPCAGDPGEIDRLAAALDALGLAGRELPRAVPAGAAPA
ncbi:MAG TPA: LLM class flavin-dependent oxidoreductase [Acidimicrobiales bacterium]|nr:LLM class flavin-dependent oxidoreductase [Acidimicrobiales bacterium]